MARMVQCIKLNKEAEGMDFAPLPGDLGQKTLAGSLQRGVGWLVKAPNHVDQ
jgi:Fe-S cluster biosynthesis and repair protein YggX